jgi:hypothetical protein
VPDCCRFQRLGEHIRSQTSSPPRHRHLGYLAKPPTRPATRCACSHVNLLGGIIYSAHCIAGVPVVQMPSVLSWIYVMKTAPDKDTVLCSGANVQVTQYFTKQLDPSRFRDGKSRNLLYDVNSLPGYLRSLSRPWGIAANMAEILEQLIACCST